MSKPQTKKSGAPVTPEKFFNDIWAARQAFALIAAVELDVFTAIAERNKTAPDVARAVNASKRGVEHLLDALVGMGYLTKKGSQYGLTPVADTFLVRTRQSYIGALTEESRMTLPGWTQLTDVIRSGRPVASVDTAEGRDFFPRLVRAIFPLTYNAARSLVGSWPQAKLKKIERILDVAAGSAAWSVPFAQALPNARVTAVDYPEVTAVARDYTQRFGVADRYDYKEGDLRQIDFGQKEFDVVILGHIIHTEGEEWGKNPEILPRPETRRRPRYRRDDSERYPHRARDAAALRPEHGYPHQRRLCLHHGSVPPMAETSRLHQHQNRRDPEPVTVDPGDAVSGVLE